MEFLEDLPEQCPPSDAQDREIGGAWRFVPDDDVKLDYFLSMAALGEIREGVDPCRLASCSMFASLSCRGMKTARGLPRFRGHKIALLHIPGGAGMSKKNKNGHIHFWMFKGFNPVSAVKKVVDKNEAHD